MVDGERIAPDDTAEKLGLEDEERREKEPFTGKSPL